MTCPTIVLLKSVLDGAQFEFWSLASPSHEFWQEAHIAKSVNTSRFYLEDNLAHLLDGRLVQMTGKEVIACADVSYSTQGRKVVVVLQMSKASKGPTLGILYFFPFPSEQAIARQTTWKSRPNSWGQIQAAQTAGSLSMRRVRLVP